jgi:hypothetical protein
VDECSADSFTVGQRVTAHPATDAWMCGDRFGTVERIGLRYVHVRMDRSGKLRRFTPRNVLPLDSLS